MMLGKAVQQALPVALESRTFGAFQLFYFALSPLLFLVSAG